MPNTHLPLAVTLSEWILALSILMFTFFAATATKAILRRLHRNRDWAILRQLAPSVSNFVYILGLKISADMAPLNSNLHGWVSDGIYVFAVILFLNFLQRAALIGVEWSSFKADRSRTLNQAFIPLFRNLITLFIFFSGSIMILKHFNYDVMSLVTALGVSSLAIGLAAKDTLSNMIAGFILIIDRNVHAGDRINLSGSIGDVEEVGLRSTLIKLTDGNTLIVPNSDLVNNRLLNLTLPSREITCTVPIRVAFSESFPRVKASCFLVLNQINQISKTKPRWVNLISLSEGYQLIHVGFWVSDLNEGPATVSAFNEKLLNHFTAEGMSFIPVELLTGRP